LIRHLRFADIFAFHSIEIIGFCRYFHGFSSFFPQHFHAFSAMFGVMNSLKKIASTLVPGMLWAGAVCRAAGFNFHICTVSGAAGVGEGGGWVAHAAACGERA
jgi:hypothetical protein